MKKYCKKQEKVNFFVYFVSYWDSFITEPQKLLDEKKKLMGMLL